MANNELIRRGNVLIDAAREGTIGFPEYQIRSLQKNYIKAQRLNFIKKMRKLFVIAAFVGVFLIFVGYEGSQIDLPLATTVDQGRAAQELYGDDISAMQGEAVNPMGDASSNQYDSEVGTEFAEMSFGLLLILGSLAGEIIFSVIRLKEKKYVEFVNIEYPKLKDAT